MSFLHGVEVIELDGGARPIQGLSSSIIGLVGTAHQGPVNKPVLVSGSRQKALDMFGTADGVSTLPDALDGIFDQTGAVVVAINVAPSDYLLDVEAEEVTLVEGKGQLEKLVALKAAGKGYLPVGLSVKIKDGDAVASTDYLFDQKSQTLTIKKEVLDRDEIDKAAVLSVSYQLPQKDKVTSGHINQGIAKLLAAENEVHVAPRILVAPGYSHKQAVANELVQVAERLRAVAIAECPTPEEGEADPDPDAKAKTYRGKFGSSRLYLIDPSVNVYDAATDSVQTQPASARVAGVIAKSDAERGFWYSPSNRPINGILSTARAIDFALGDRASTANLLNEKDIATVIRQDGYRLWGNRSCSADPKWQFISVRRTADLINDALQRAHMWAIDRNITKTYIEDVSEGVNNYLRHLKSIGAIINGKCWADPALNTPDLIAQGKVTFDFDFVPPYPAEHITFRSALNNSYLEEVFA